MEAAIARIEAMGARFGNVTATLAPAYHSHQAALKYQEQGNREEAKASYEEALRVAGLAHTSQIKEHKSSKISRCLAQIYGRLGAKLQFDGI